MRLTRVFHNHVENSRIFFGSFMNRFLKLNIVGNNYVFLELVGLFKFRERVTFPKITMIAMTIVVVVVSICSFESDSLEMGLFEGFEIAESFNEGWSIIV